MSTSVVLDFYVIMFDYITFSEFQFFSIFSQLLCKRNVKPLWAVLRPNNGYVTEQINGITQMGPEFEKKT